MPTPYLQNVTLDQNLLLEFFLTFARFEFALKTSGFVVGDDREARPDWDRFGQSLDLARGRQDPSFAAAHDYLSLHPPARQVLVAAGVAWDASVPFTQLERMDHVLMLVRRVRNNLFHGGKFSDEMHSAAGRNRLLLEHSIVILRQCLDLAPGVAATYASATL